MIRPLLVDHRDSSVKNITQFLIDKGEITPETVKNAFDASISLGSGNFNVVISYYSLEDINGIELFKTIRAREIRTPFILYTDQYDPVIAIDAMKSGIDYYLGDISSDSARALLVAVVKNVVLRGQILERLQLDNKILKTIQEASPFAACVVRDHIIVWNNDLMSLMLGYGENELIGTDPASLIPNEQEHCRIDKGLFESPTEHGWGSAEGQIMRKDGSLINCHLLSRPLDPVDLSQGHVIIGQDVSEYVRMKELLRISELRYQNLIDSASSIVLRVDTKGSIRFINKFGEAFFDYPSDELIGKNIVGTIVPKISRAGRDLSVMIQDVMARPEGYEVNVNENMKRNGERVWIAWTNKAIRDEKGGVVEMLSIGNDITDRKLSAGDIQISTAPWKRNVILDTDIDAQVFETVYAISVELSREGREGKPIGTIFLIGDAKNVLAKSTQLILNPFEGHPISARIITDPGIRETIKELSQIDGAFVICGDGVVEAAGRYITIDTSRAYIPPGLGTRHASVAGITQETKAVGIVVSQSGGKISIFKDGRIFRVITMNE